MPDIKDFSSLESSGWWEFVESWPVDKIKMYSEYCAWLRDKALEEAADVCSRTQVTTQINDDNYLICDGKPYAVNIRKLKGKQ